MRNFLDIHLVIKISDRKSQRFHLHKTICLDQFSNSLALLLFLFNFINILSLIVYIFYCILLFAAFLPFQLFSNRLWYIYTNFYFLLTLENDLREVETLWLSITNFTKFFNTRQYYNDMFWKDKYAEHFILTFLV